jgi:hypothetical protein
VAVRRRKRLGQGGAARRRDSAVAAGDADRRFGRWLVAGSGGAPLRRSSCSSPHLRLLPTGKEQRALGRSSSFLCSYAFWTTTVAPGLLASPATIPAVEPTQHLGLKVHTPSLRLFGATIKSRLALILDFGSRTVQTGVLF